MRAAGAHEEAIRAFESAYRRLESGDEAVLPTADLEPAGDVPALEDLPDADAAQALASVAVIKLNGGLATTMGLQEPKSLVQARDGRSFLEIIVGQTLALRRRFGVRLALVLMNSDATREATERALAGFPELEHEGIPPDFMQSMIPKLDAEQLTPVSWPQAPALEWCPPGHGDVYGALRRSGMLDTLLEHGFRYAMISNSDNLGAQLDARVAAHIQEQEIPFLMEVVRGTEGDRKGGHIARRRSDGQLVLRETAQTPPEDEESFRDFRRWRYYNTNNLWLDLRVLADTLERSGGVLELPLIVNRKTVDPRDSELAGGDPARKRHGGRDRELQRCRSAAGAAHAVRAGQEHRRPARAAIRCLRDGRAARGRAGARARRQPPLRRARQALLQADR